ncbi:MAG: hypothetical protein IKQ55_03305 [Kiritimatiellae bacterium]|nr:hypothetical protein [Kiritimatiellia bacterium]
MNRTDAADRLAAGYLEAVGAAMAGRPEQERRDVLAQLAEQLDVAVRAAEPGPGESEEEVMGRILEGMDPPENFVVGAGAMGIGDGGGNGENGENGDGGDGGDFGERGRGGDGGRRGPGGWWWFALAVLFFAVNVWGLFGGGGGGRAGGEASGPEEAEPEEVVEEPPLPEPEYMRVMKLRRVSVMDSSADRTATLLLTFSAEPDRLQLTRHFRLEDGDGAAVGYRIEGLLGQNTVALATDPVATVGLRWTLDAGLESSEPGVVPLEEGERGMLEMDRNLEATEAEAYARAFEEPYVRIRLTGAPEGEREKVEPYVEVKPPVKFRASAGRDWEGCYLQLEGAFRPDSFYEIALKAGLPGSDGRRSLSRDFRRTLQIPRPSARVELEKSGRYLPPSGPLAVPVRTCGARSVCAQAWKVYPANLADAVLSREMRSWKVMEDEWGGKWHTLTNIPVRPDVPGPGGAEAAPGTGRALVPLRKLAGEEEPRGAWWVRVEPEGDGWSGDSQLVVVTDLGLSVRLGVPPGERGAGMDEDGSALVWVNSLRTAKAEEGVRVEIVSSHHQLLASGTTDADGIARLEWTAGADGGTPAVVVASKDGDQTYLALDRALAEGDGGVRDWPGEGLPEAEFAAGRGVYRPGETACLEAYVRGIDLGVPEPFPAVAVLRAPDGRVALEKAVETGGLGTVALELPIPGDAPTGRWELSLETPGGSAVLGRTSFSVEDFMPPQIRVDVTGPEGRQAAADVEKLKFAVKAEYLFGGPAARLPAEGVVSWKAVPFAPAGWQGWTFGDPRKKFAESDARLGQYPLAADGSLAFVVPVRREPAPPAALRAVFGATVRTAGGRAVSDFASVLVDPYPFYVGLRPAWEGTVPVAATQRVQVAAVAPGGGAPDAESTPALLLSLVKVEWNSSLRRNSSGRYEWRSEREEHVVERATRSLGLSGDGRLAADWAFAVPSPGEWEILAEDPESGSSTRLSFHAGSRDWWWDEAARANPAELQLEWEGEGPRKPGDKAKLLVKSPFPGEALLTIETTRVLLARRVVLDGNTAEIEVEVGEDWAPSVRAALSVLRPAAPGDTAWMGYRAHGTAALQVDRPERRLAVAISAPATVLPRAPLEVELAVSGPDGAPVAGGEVTLFAVDEAICMLTGHETPDPLARFNEIRRSLTDLHDLYADIIEPEPDGADAVSAPGGDAAGAFRKRLNPVRANRYTPLAFWRPGLALDKNGRARATVELPEFAGEVRLMAVACTEGGLGSASAPVKVHRDLVVQPSLPRFLAPGDRCTLSVPVHNLSSNAMTVAVRVACGGPLACAEAGRTVELDAGAETLLTFPLVAGDASGKAVCTVEAEAEGAPSERYHETFELAVRPAGGLSLRTAFGVLQPGESAELPPPEGFVPGSGSRTLHVSAMPSIDLCRALQYVAWYPYGCLEQTVSGAYPLLHSEEWAERLAPGAWAAGDPRSRIRAAISRVLSMQTQNGGFALWPWLRDTDTENSLYAVRFLLDARAAGHDVPEFPLERALDWVRRWVLEDRLPATADTFTPAWRGAMRLRAEACRVLAAAGRAPSGWIDRLCERTGDLDFAARVHLACALREAGDPRRAADLLSSLPVPVPRPRRGGDCHDGDVREAAMLLDAWAETDPESRAAVQLAAYLRSRRGPDGHWGCTQDNALALCAFGKLARNLPAAERPVSFECAFGGAEPAARSGELDWVGSGADTDPVRLANTGGAPLYYVLQDTGVDLEPPALCADGIAVDREFFDWEGNPVDPSELKQGDLLIVRTTIRKLRDGDLSNLAAEDLLPAGWEIENLAFKTSTSGGTWLQTVMKSDNCWTDARDDRMLLFPSGFGREGRARAHYAVRAVSPGEFILPSVTASGMYDPGVRAVGPAPRTVRVTAP